jgi:hypothetical protein
MQATATTTEATSPGTTTVERRPVRLLVPTVRRTVWHVPEQDTLIAAEVGLTRHTDDNDLTHMIRPAMKLLDGHTKQDAEAYLRRIRDGLRHPRSIDDARTWGMIIPEDQNAEEFSDKEKNRTGWWWVLDPTRTETQVERKARMLADHRLIPMKGVARIWMRSYFTVKDFKVDGDRSRRLITDPDFLREQAAKRIAIGKGIGTDLEATIADELAKARRFVIKALPPRRDRIAESDVWYVADGCTSGRDTTRLDDWYEFNKVSQSGRPPGSKTRNHNRPRAAADLDRKTS